MISVEKMGLLISWSLFYLPLLLGRFFWFICHVTNSTKTFIAGYCTYGPRWPNFNLQQLIYPDIDWHFSRGIGGFANIFPLIFSITIEYMPSHTNELSGLMVSAIAGGAFIPPIMGMVADGTSIQTAFIVPVLCIIYLLFVAIINNRKTQNV